MAANYTEDPITDPDSIAFEIDAAADQSAFNTFFSVGIANFILVSSVTLLVSLSIGTLKSTLISARLLEKSKLSIFIDRIV